MAQLREQLVEELQFLLSAEQQLTQALPKMASAAHNPKLKEAFQKHLKETEIHVERLQKAFEKLGGSATAKNCKAMQGLIAAGEEVIAEGKKKDPVVADISLAGAAQKVEHYEISGYGTARGIAKLIGERDVAMLLSHTLGEEEATDFLLTDVSKPLLQEASTSYYSNAHAHA